MSKTPFMPLWVGDFIAKTQDLDAKETGAYMLILMSMWTRDGSLPHDLKKLQRVARVGRDWAKVWASIEGYFQVRDGKIFNARLSEELHKVNAKREVNAHAGKRGGLAKALKNKEAPLANATVSLKQSEPEPYKEERDTKVSPKRKSRISPDAVISEPQKRAAEKRQLSEQEALAQFGRFKNHALANGKMFVDWDRAFVTWLDSPYFKPMYAINGGNYERPQNSKAGKRPDPAIEQIARLAGLSAASGNGGG